MSTFPKGSCSSFGHTFEMLRLHRLEAAIVPRNAASRRVADKLGLRDEGTAHRFLQIQGVYEDHIRYAITREEWRDAVISSSRASSRRASTNAERRAPLGSLLALVVGVGLAHEEVDGPAPASVRLHRGDAQRARAVRKGRRAGSAFGAMSSTISTRGS